MIDVDFSGLNRSMTSASGLTGQQQTLFDNLTKALKPPPNEPNMESPQELMQAMQNAKQAGDYSAANYYKVQLDKIEGQRAMLGVDEGRAAAQKNAYMQQQAQLEQARVDKLNDPEHKGKMEKQRLEIENMKQEQIDLKRDKELERYERIPLPKSQEKFDSLMKALERKDPEGAGIFQERWVERENSLSLIESRKDTTAGEATFNPISDTEAENMGLTPVQAKQVNSVGVIMGVKAANTQAIKFINNNAVAPEGKGFSDTVLATRFKEIATADPDYQEEDEDENTGKKKEAAVVTGTAIEIYKEHGGKISMQKAYAMAKAEGDKHVPPTPTGDAVLDSLNMIMWEAKLAEG